MSSVLWIDGICLGELAWRGGSGVNKPGQRTFTNRVQRRWNRVAKTRTERFCEALGKCDGVDSISTAADGTIAVRSNGGGITLTPTMAPLGLKPAHPDNALCRDTPSAIARAFRKVLGTPCLGFSGTSNLRPEVTGVECTIDTKGNRYLVVGKSGARQEVYEINLWRCEKVARNTHDICVYDNSEILAALAG